MTSHKGEDGGGDYHLNSSNNEGEPHDISSTVANHWLPFRRCFHCKDKKNLMFAVIAVVVGLMTLLVTVMAVVKNNQRLASHAQQCPSNVDRWVEYNGAYFSYSLYLHQWPNPDPKILILHGGAYYGAADDDNDDEDEWGDFNYDDDYYEKDKNNPNNFAIGQGCTAGSWAVTYGYADGKSFSMAYNVPSDDDRHQSRLRQEGGTFFIGGVEYDLKNNGSVFLIEFQQENNDDNNNNNQVTKQLSGLDLSSLVIDEETMSVASVTAFCYANQDILDFFDSTLSADNNDNSGDR